MNDDRLPDLGARGATMREPQLRAALRQLQRAYGAGTLEGDQYIRIVGYVMAEHPPRDVMGRLWGRSSEEGGKR